MLLLRPSLLQRAVILGIIKRALLMLRMRLQLLFQRLLLLRVKEATSAASPGGSQLTSLLQLANMSALMTRASAARVPSRHAAADCQDQEPRLIPSKDKDPNIADMHYIHCISSIFISFSSSYGLAQSKGTTGNVKYHGLRDMPQH